MALVLFLSLAAYGTWTAPIPGINEPHYLGKAKHFWNPEWCARDLFLQSADAHWFFYATFGTLTRVLTLEQTAWVGRVMVWGLLAWGWARLAVPIFSFRWAAVGALWFYLAWFSTGNVPQQSPMLGWIAAGSFSGEWLAGGVESKGFAYGLLFLALAEANARRWNRAAVCFGLSISFHPVVGGWGAIAGALAVLFRLREIRSETGNDDGIVRHFVTPALLCGLLSLPGLIPALAMLAAAPSREIARQADELQVLVRLDHHLDPVQFPQQVFTAYGWLFAAWLIGRRRFCFARAERFFFPFVFAGAVIAAAGLLIGFGPRWLGVMKYYPFRLFDVFLPLGAVTLLLEWLSISRLRRLVAAALSLAALLFALGQPTIGQNPTGWINRDHWPAFLEACRWIDANTPPDALFLTQRRHFAFKWYAQRAEYVSYKDVPQDATGILEWNRRLELVAAWRTKYTDKDFDAAAVDELQQATGVDFILAWNSASADPYTQPPVYKNRSFAVYRVGK